MQSAANSTLVVSTIASTTNSRGSNAPAVVPEKEFTTVELLGNGQALVQKPHSVVIVGVGTAAVGQAHARVQ